MKKQLCILLIVLSSSLITPLAAQNISTMAGDNAFGPGYSGDGGAAVSAELANPYAVAFDATGNMYIADEGNQVIRKVDHTTGDISTVAGNNSYGQGYSGDGGPATAAELRFPSGVAIDPSGNILIADASNNIIRKVDHSTGNISTIAGTPTIAGYNGDGGPATAAEFSNPSSICIDVSGNIFIADDGNMVIRRIDHSTENISTVAGNHILGAGYSGDNGAATAAQLNGPSCVSVDASDNIFIADHNNQVIRMVTNSNGFISTVAGNHAFGKGYSGDGGPATNAELAYPWGVKVDGLGNLFISDNFNSVIREVYSSNGTIGTIAGDFVDGFGYSGDGGPATNAELYAPQGVALDASGNLYIADNLNSVVRKVNSVTIGIDEINTVANDVAVYPNPSSGEFIIALSHSELVSASQTKVEVYNVLGEKVFDSVLPQTPKGALNQIDLRALSNGVYFMQLINGQQSISKKIVIEK